MRVVAYILLSEKESEFFCWTRNNKLASNFGGADKFAWQIPHQNKAVYGVSTKYTKYTWCLAAHTLCLANY